MNEPIKPDPPADLRGALLAMKQHFYGPGEQEYSEAECYQMAQDALAALAANAPAGQSEQLRLVTEQRDALLTASRNCKPETAIEAAERIEQYGPSVQRHISIPWKRYQELHHAVAKAISLAAPEPQPAEGPGCTKCDAPATTSVRVDTGVKGIAPGECEEEQNVPMCAECAERDES